MRNREADEQFLRDTVKESGINALVYITPNHYDGGYEVRIDAQDVFVEYDAIDASDTSWVERLR